MWCRGQTSNDEDTICFPLLHVSLSVCLLLRRYLSDPTPYLIRCRMLLHCLFFSPACFSTLPFFPLHFIPQRRRCLRRLPLHWHFSSLYSVAECLLL